MITMVETEAGRKTGNGKRLVRIPNCVGGVGSWQVVSNRAAFLTKDWYS